MERIYLILILFISITFLSCDKNVGEEVLYSPDLRMPVVTGLYFTGEDSPEVLGYWRNPPGSNSHCRRIKPGIYLDVEWRHPGLDCRSIQYPQPYEWRHPAGFHAVGSGLCQPEYSFQ